MAKKQNIVLPFERHLVLFRYMLGEIGLAELQTIGKKLNNVEYEGVDESGNTFSFIT